MFNNPAISELLNSLESNMNFPAFRCSRFMRFSNDLVFSSVSLTSVERSISVRTSRNALNVRSSIQSEIDLDGDKRRDWSAVRTNCRGCTSMPSTSPLQTHPDRTPLITRRFVILPSSPTTPSSTIPLTFASLLPLYKGAAACGCISAPSRLRIRREGVSHCLRAWLNAASTNQIHARNNQPTTR